MIVSSCLSSHSQTNSLKEQVCICSSLPHSTHCYPVFTSRTPKNFSVMTSSRFFSGLQWTFSSAYFIWLPYSMGVPPLSDFLPLLYSETQCCWFSQIALTEVSQALILWLLILFFVNGGDFPRTHPDLFSHPRFLLGKLIITMASILIQSSMM